MKTDMRIYKEKCFPEGQLYNKEKEFMKEKINKLETYVQALPANFDFAADMKQYLYPEADKTLLFEQGYIDLRRGYFLSFPCNNHSLLQY